MTMRCHLLMKVLNYDNGWSFEREIEIYCCQTYYDEDELDDPCIHDPSPGHCDELLNGNVFWFGGNNPNNGNNEDNDNEEVVYDKRKMKTAFSNVRLSQNVPLFNGQHVFHVFANRDDGYKLKIVESKTKKAATLARRVNKPGIVGFDTLAEAQAFVNSVISEYNN